MTLVLPASSAGSLKLVSEAPQLLTRTVHGPGTVLVCVTQVP